METRKNMEITNGTPRLNGGELLEVLQWAVRLVGCPSRNGLPQYIETAPNGDYRITDLRRAKDDLINAIYVTENIASSVCNSLSAARDYMGGKSRQELLDELRVEDTPDASYYELAAISVADYILSYGAALRELAQWRGMQASPFIHIDD